MLFAFVCLRDASGFDLWEGVCSKSFVPLFLFGADTVCGTVFLSLGGLFLSVGLSFLPDAVCGEYGDGKAAGFTVFTADWQMDSSWCIGVPVRNFANLIIDHAPCGIRYNGDAQASRGRGLV